MEAIKTALPLNWELIGNPINWVVIVLMIVIAGAALTFIFPSAAPILDE